MKNTFELLKNRKIIAILDGDANFGELKSETILRPISISMPYLSGPDLCKLSNRFGLNVEYDRNGNAKSRREYLCDLIDFCISKKNVADLVSYIFGIWQFSYMFFLQPPEIMPTAHKQIVEIVIGKINEELLPSGYELVKVRTRFLMRTIGRNKQVIEKTMTHAYIADLSIRTREDIFNYDFDSAIGKAGAMLEEVFCYVIEQKGQMPCCEDDLFKLYEQVKVLYNMQSCEDMDERVIELLSGLQKILSSITQMRDNGGGKQGDCAVQCCEQSGGVRDMNFKKLHIAEHHTRLFIASAKALADFVLSVSIAQGY